MVEHHRHRRRCDKLLDAGDHRQRGIDLYMPVARLHALGGGLEALPRHVGIVDAAGCEVEADAADAGLPHGVEAASVVLSSITATPRAFGPRAFMPNSVGELSGP